MVVSKWACQNEAKTRQNDRGLIKLPMILPGGDVMNFPGCWQVVSAAASFLPTATGASASFLPALTVANAQVDMLSICYSILSFCIEGFRFLEVVLFCQCQSMQYWYMVMIYLLSATQCLWPSLPLLGVSLKGRRPALIASTSWQEVEETHEGINVAVSVPVNPCCKISILLDLFLFCKWLNHFNLFLFLRNDNLPECKLK